MTDYTAAIAQINNATTLDQIIEVANQFAATATGSGGVLYSGNVGAASAHQIAVDLADTQGTEAALLIIIQTFAECRAALCDP